MSDTLKPGDAVLYTGLDKPYITCHIVAKRDSKWGSSYLYDVIAYNEDDTVDFSGAVKLDEIIPDSTRPPIEPHILQADDYRRFTVGDHVIIKRRDGELHAKVTYADSSGDEHLRIPQNSRRVYEFTETGGKGRSQTIRPTDPDYYENLECTRLDRPYYRKYGDIPKNG